MKYISALALALSVSGALAAPAAAPAKPSEKECQCNEAKSKCQGAPSANQSFCASQFVSCSGVQPYEGSGKTTSVSPTDYFNNLNKNCPAPKPETSKPSEKTCQCYTALGKCQTAPYPGGNHAQCASEFASCSGTNPYGTPEVSAFFKNLEDNCSKTAAPTSSAAPAPSKSAAPAPPAKTPAADKGYGSYGTYEKYPSNYASYGKYDTEMNYASYGSYKE
ncbi:hypothetical protein Slin15195_G106820 [Septoria linicola]|uniref:Uncharacterized protein n=1 Tax=Septoria linicola TaxID=215465 RepID=A0A9Q9EQB3_9PEZI|nr:hypothetical protein Slin14017_G069790 [Septoria linicola]USW57363.1 hypothetical protein Slin15195_G106820 [Septoria linicola]